MSASPFQEKFESKLAKALLETNVIGKRELAEALEQQVLAGGHLATNLWELGICDVATLTRQSAAILQVKPVPPQVVAEVPVKIRKLLPARFVEAHRMLPLRVKGRELGVATAEPWDIEALDAAAKVTHLKVRPFFLAEVPLVQLMDKLYRIPAAARFRLKPTPRFKPVATTVSMGEAVTEDLISDEEFTSIYGAGDALTAGDATPTAPVAPAAPPAPKQAVPPPVAQVVKPADDADTMLGPVTMSAEDEALVDEIIELADVVEEEPVAPVVAEVAAIMDVKEAYQALEAATDRDDLGEVLVRFALSRGKRAVLFTRQGDLWIGWTGAGPGVTPGAIRALMLPSEKGTLFGLVGVTGAHFLGPIQKHAIHERFYEILGGGKPQSAGLFPVRFHNRIVFGIYMDGGDGGYVNPDIADVLILAQRVPLALERLVKAKARQAVAAA